MPILIKCKQCTISSWNRLPPSFGFMQSIHIMKDGKFCPICGEKLGDYLGEPESSPLESISFGGGIGDIKLENLDKAIEATKRAIDIFDSYQKNPKATFQMGDPGYSIPYLIIREFVYGMPYAVPALSNKSISDYLLSGFCEIANEKSEEKGNSTRIMPNQIDIKSYAVNSFPVILIQMPIPEVTPNPFFAGILIKKKLDKRYNFIDSLPSESEDIIYFTLEKTKSSNPFLTNMLVSWDHQAQRKNWGYGSTPNRIEFLKYIERLSNVI